MTARLKGFVVTLEQDLREDDAEATLSAIKQIKGVISVEPVVADLTQHMAQERVKREIAQKMWEVLFPK